MLEFRFVAIRSAAELDLALRRALDAPADAPIPLLLIDAPALE